MGPIWVLYGHAHMGLPIWARYTNVCWDCVIVCQRGSWWNWSHTTSERPDHLWRIQLQTLNNARTEWTQADGQQRGYVRRVANRVTDQRGNENTDHPVNTWGHGSLTVMTQTLHTMMLSLWHHINVRRTSHCEASHCVNTVTSGWFTHIISANDAQVTCVWASWSSN